MEQKHTELESRFHAINGELESTRKEASTATSEHESAKKQIEILTKEKGVAMRDNAASYQQSIQMETQVGMAQYSSVYSQYIIFTLNSSTIIGITLTLSSLLTFLPPSLPSLPSTFPPSLLPSLFPFS